MLFSLLTLFVSAAEVPAANGASCLLPAPGRHESALAAFVVDASARREDQAASRRAHAPAALPAARFAFSPRLLSCALYAPPALGPREQAALPSSQRDPPDSLA